MQNKQQINHKKQRTKSAITQAFKEMVCEMDLKSITVKELACRAGINRKTFYLHYSCIEALCEDIIQQLCQFYYMEVEKLNVPYSTKDLTRVFFTTITSCGVFIEKIFFNPSYQEFCHRLLTASFNHNHSHYKPYAFLSHEKQNLVNNYILSVTHGFYHQWMKDGKKIPLNEVIDFVSQILDHGIFSITEEING